MKKYISDLTISFTKEIGNNYHLLKLTSETVLPEMQPGQFVEIKVDHTPEVLLRRPISINYVDRENNELWLLIHAVGKGTQAICSLKSGEKLNLVFPLGNGFSLPTTTSERLLLVGGGVGTAPMLYLGAYLKERGFVPEFLLGGRSRSDIMQIEEFEQLGPVYITTEDASAGEQGFVTQHSILQNETTFQRIYTCGPKPMMQAIASYAKRNNIECEVSLENMMACGVGACLCCVENTVKGNVCVCKEGPVFNINQLSWQI